MNFRACGCVRKRRSECSVTRPARPCGGLRSSGGSPRRCSPAPAPPLALAPVRKCENYFTNWEISAKSGKLLLKLGNNYTNWLLFLVWTRYVVFSRGRLGVARLHLLRLLLAPLFGSAQRKFIRKITPQNYKITAQNHKTFAQPKLPRKITTQNCYTMGS